MYLYTMQGDFMRCLDVASLVRSEMRSNEHEFVDEMETDTETDEDMATLDNEFNADSLEFAMDDHYVWLLWQDQVLQLHFL